MPSHCLCSRVLSVSASLHLSSSSSLCLYVCLQFSVMRSGAHLCLPLRIFSVFLSCCLFSTLRAQRAPLSACYQVKKELVKQFQALWLVLPVTFTAFLQEVFGGSALRLAGSVPWFLTGTSCFSPLGGSHVTAAGLTHLL